MKEFFYLPRQKSTLVNKVISLSTLLLFLMVNMGNSQDCDPSGNCEWTTIMEDSFEDVSATIDGIVTGSVGHEFPQGNFSGNSIFHGKARTGDSYMYMNFQGLTAPFQAFVREVDVCPNAEVRVSFWHRDLQAPAPYDATINIYDGQGTGGPLLSSGNIASTAPNFTYKEYTSGVFTPSTGFITFELVSNLVRHTDGNDLCIDDLLFEMCDPEPVQIEVEVCDGQFIDLYDYVIDCTDENGVWTGATPLAGDHFGTFNTDFNDLGIYRYTNGCLEFDINVSTVEYDVFADYLFDVLCEGDEQNISINVTPSGGNYEVLWLHDNVDAYDRELGPGTYDIEVTDLDNGCSTLETITIDPRFIDETYPTIVICEGEEIDLFEDGNLVSTEGSYTGFLVNQYGCDSTVNATLEVIDLGIDPEVDGILSCENATVDLTSTFTADSGYDDSMIEWELPNGDIMTGADITSNQEGTHTVTLTVVYSDGTTCSIVETIDVDGNSDVPTFTPLVDIAIDCTGDQDAILTPETEDDNIVTWSDDTGTLSMGDTLIINETNIIYLEIVNPASGCVVHDTVSVVVDNDIPELNIDGNLIDCTVTTSELMGVTAAENVTYSWSHENNSGEISDQPNITVDSAGVYTLTIIDENDCQISETYDVVVDTIAPIITLSDVTIECDMGDITLTTPVVEGETITWTNSNNDNLGMDDNISVSEGGDFTATLLNTTNGCETIETITVTDLGDSPELTLTDGFLNCDIDDVTLNASTNQSDVTYEWTFNSANVSNSDNTVATEGGDYTVTVTSTTGCVTTEITTVDVDYTTPTVSLSNGDVLDCVVTSATLEASVTDGDTFSWT